MNNLKGLLFAMVLTPSLVLAHSHDISTFDIKSYVGFKYFVSSNGGEPIESYPEAGMLLNWEMTENFHTFVQLGLNRDGVEHGLEHLLIYGFTDYSNTITNIPLINTMPFRISVGKLKHEFGLYSDRISNPTTRPGVMPPQAIYWNALTTTLTSGYGFKAEIWLGDFNFGYTMDKYITADKKVESLTWTGVDFIDMDPTFGNHRVINVNWEPDEYDVRMRSSLTSIKLNDDVDTIQMLTIGVEYDNSNWLLSGEVLGVKSKDLSWLADFSDLRYGLSGTIGKMVMDNMQIYFNYNTYLNSHIGDMPGVNDNVTDWSDFNIGTVYEIGDLDMRLEVHRIYGGRLQQPKDWDRTSNSWWLIGTSMTYQF